MDKFICRRASPASSALRFALCGDNLAISIGGTRIASSLFALLEAVTSHFGPICSVYTRDRNSIWLTAPKGRNAMKIQCPVCQASYNLHVERITKPVVKATCRKCGKGRLIYKDTGEVDTLALSAGQTEKPPTKNIQTANSSPPLISERVGQRTPRDYPAIIVVIAVLLLLAAAGYYLVSTSSKGSVARPGKYVSKEVKSSDRLARVSSQSESKKKPSAGAPTSHSREKPHTNRLPATTTNKQLAEYVRIKPDIENLYLDNCRNITDISPLASLSRLSLLSLDWCSKVEDISPLTNLKSLKQLNLHRCDAVVDLTPLTKMASLRVLHLPSTITDEQLAQVSTHLPRLEKLILKDCHLVTDISPVAGLTNLKHLEMNPAPELVDITPLAGLTHLKVLDLKNSQVQDLGPLVKLSGLEWLYLSNSNRLHDISPLKNLTNLTILSLDRCKEVRDITPLSHLTKLTILNLSGMEQLSDISTLSNLRQLRNLYLRRCKKINLRQMRELRKSLPRCSIEYHDAQLGVAR